MSGRRLVHFETTGPAADERLVREYVIDAVERLAEGPDSGRIGFIRAGQKPGIDGLVLVEVVGDVDAVVERERDRWDALVEEGLAEGWRLGEGERDLAGYWGEDGADLETRLRLLAARLSGPVYEEFETRPAPSDAHPAETDERASPTGVGWWVLLHALSLQQGYDYRAEVDAYATAIQYVLDRIARAESGDAAREVLDEVLASLEGGYEEVDGGESAG